MTSPPRFCVPSWFIPQSPVFTRGQRYHSLESTRRMTLWLLAPEQGSAHYTQSQLYQEMIPLALNRSLSPSALRCNYLFSKSEEERKGMREVIWRGSKLWGYFPRRQQWRGCRGGPESTTYVEETHAKLDTVQGGSFRLVLFTNMKELQSITQVNANSSPPQTQKSGSLTVNYFV